MISNLPVSYPILFPIIIDFMKFSFVVPFFPFCPVLSPLLESLTLPWCKKQLAINQQTWNNFPPECEISIMCQDFITVQASNGPADSTTI